MGIALPLGACVGISATSPADSLGANTVTGNSAMPGSINSPRSNARHHLK